VPSSGSPHCAVRGSGSTGGERLAMSFIWPTMLLSLLAVPLLVLLHLGLQRRRRRLAASWVGLGRGQEAGPRRYVPTGILMAGLTLLLVAMARPQATVQLPQVEGTVILAFDVSGSMAAEDLKPNRLEAAKSAAIDFLEHRPQGVQVGVVAFSDNGFTVQVPTDDDDAILGTISRLAPESGTSIANGIFASLNLIATLSSRPTPHLYTDLTPAPPATPTPVPPGTFVPAAIVLLTDGENNEDPDPLAAAQASADRGVRIYAVGIGSTAGTMLEVNGFVVHTQLDEETLQQVARRTGGAYYSAANEEDLNNVFRNINPQLAIRSQEMEVTSLFAGASILALLVGAALSLLWFSRVP
jgi:Ca-activated chloride channel homolog